MEGTEDGPASEVKMEADHDTMFKQHEKYKDGILHIGCCGGFEV